MKILKMYKEWKKDYNKNNNWNKLSDIKKLLYLQWQSDYFIFRSFFLIKMLIVTFLSFFVIYFSFYNLLFPFYVFFLLFLFYFISYKIFELDLGYRKKSNEIINKLYKEQQNEKTKKRN